MKPGFINAKDIYITLSSIMTEVLGLTVGLPDSVVWSNKVITLELFYSFLVNHKNLGIIQDLIFVVTVKLE